MKKLTKKDFIERATCIHNNKYDYTKVEYVNSTTKACIICPEHGEFWQTPKNHLRYGCPKCAIEKRAMANKGTKEKFIQNAIEIHGKKYDYSMVEYEGYNTPVRIICPTHGEFWQSPTKHLNSLGCPKCVCRNEDKKDTLSDFIFKSKMLYGEKFDYSKTNYVNSRTEVTIICPKHGEFSITPHDHLHVSGCPQCTKENIRLNKIKKEKEYIEERNKRKEIKALSTLKRKDKFIEKAQRVHGDKYDYSKVEYVNNNTKVCIICPEHGEFWQTPSNHTTRRTGCPKCAWQKNKEKNVSNAVEFIEKAQRVHGDKYDYSKVEYVNSITKVCIICPEHGEFWQTPSMHYCEKQGCPNCGALSSKGENEVIGYLRSILPECEIIQREHHLIKHKEIDIYIPSLKIAIEYDGLRWHSELFNKDKYYHLTKTEECEKKGVRMIHIFEDEWVHHKEIVKDKLRHILNVGNDKKIFARKCIVREINHRVSEEFLSENHIQGSAIASIHLGLYFNDYLIAVMTLIKRKDEWELNRFATQLNYSVIGAGGKLFSYFIKKYAPSYVKSFADLRWTSKEKNIYEKIGFTKEEILPPNYTYVTNKNSFKRRYHKFNFRKQVLHKKYGIPLSMTEEEMTKELGYYKIWDCGLIKYVYHP